MLAPSFPFYRFLRAHMFMHERPGSHHRASEVDRRFKGRADLARQRVGEPTPHPREHHALRAEEIAIGLSARVGRISASDAAIASDYPTCERPSTVEACRDSFGASSSFLPLSRF